MNEKLRIQVEPLSTFTFTRDSSYIAFVLFTPVRT